LVGALVVAAAHNGTPGDLWSRWGDATALQRTEFDGYLAGCRHACAIEIVGSVRFPESIELEELRRRHSGFVTPQSYRYLVGDESAVLLNGEAQHLGALTKVAYGQMAV
jgi:predicted transcriptional regulator